MCRSYLTKAYLKISRASSCKCTKMTKCLPYNQENFTRFLEKTLLIWYLSQVGMGL